MYLARVGWKNLYHCNNGNVPCSYSGVGIQSVICSSMEEALVHILSPKHFINVLQQDVMKCKEIGCPFITTFCSIYNGVEKSTNLC